MGYFVCNYNKKAVNCWGSHNNQYTPEEVTMHWHRFNPNISFIERLHGKSICELRKNIRWLEGTCQ